MGIEWNPHCDKDGNCVNCGTGQLDFDGKSTGCACSRVADAEYEEMQRIIKLLEVLNTCDCNPDDSQAKHYRCGASQGLPPSEVIALIKGEN